MAELTFLGTGAADWEISERNGFFRRNSSALINNDLIIDCGEHVFDFAEEAGNKDLYDCVTDILITHNHSDHFSKDSILKIAEKQKIRVGCDRAVAEKIGEHENIEYIILKPFEKVKIGKYTVMPVLANHDIVALDGAYAFHYIIETPDKKKIFYGLDGAWFLRPSWEEMKEHKFDVMIFDCTVGDFDDWRVFEHNTIPMLRVLIKHIKECNMPGEGARLIASHLAKTLHEGHEETAKILEKTDLECAYDGMKISF